MEITELGNFRVGKRWLREVALKTMEEVGERGTLSLVLVNNSRIKELNRKYLGRDRETDVLSFPKGEKFVSPENLVGEVVISVEKAKENARERGHTLKEELSLLVIHGVLHLGGYEEGKEMEEKEKRILGTLGLNPEIV